MLEQIKGEWSSVSHIQQRDDGQHYMVGFLNLLNATRHERTRSGKSVPMYDFKSGEGLVMYLYKNYVVLLYSSAPEGLESFRKGPSLIEN